jgi:putative glutamine amidotransferase
MAEKKHPRPRVGVPWRTSAEEAANQRVKIDKYLRAVEVAGGEAVLLSLAAPPGELRRQAASLDAVLLTGSPADIDPAHFHASRHAATAQADAARERADFALLEHALHASKPVLAICYGIQSLNVFLGGSLVQDIPTEIGVAICHSPADHYHPDATEIADPLHDVALEAGHLRSLCGAAQAQVNSSHHQSILAPGRGLKITASAADGVVEAVEWREDDNWIVGVQWHPERMPADALSQALFGALILAGSEVKAAK